MHTTKVKRILAIDDDGLVRKSLELFLKEAGYEPIVAESGEEALRILSGRHFDLLVTDIRMPGMDGLQVIQAVREYCRQMKKNPIPEIVLTAYNDERVKESVERLGVRNFILKPFRADEFLRILERSLNPC
jgi:two-component system, NtrC family, response regulator AtoC